MTTGSRRVILLAALTLAALQAGLGAWFLAMSIGDRYAAVASVGLAGGVAAFVALLMVPLRPKIGGAGAYVGSLLGATLWVSVVPFFLALLLVPAILGVTVIYGETRVAAPAKLALWALSVLAFGLCFLGLNLVAAFLGPLPSFYLVLFFGIMLLPLLLLLLLMASRSLRDPASLIARLSG